MSEYDFDFLTNSKEANKEAILLAKIRYNEQLAPFVQSPFARDREARLKYASDHIERIIDECVEATPGAEREIVDTRLREIIAKEVAVTQPETKDPEQSFFEGKGTIPDQNGTEPVGHAVEQDILDSEGVLVEEILNPDAQVDADVPISEGTVQYPRRASLKEKLANLDDYVAFGLAFNDLGNSIQEQLNDLLDHGPHANLNPNAVHEMKSLIPYLPDDEAAELVEVLEEWEKAQYPKSSKVACARCDTETDAGPLCEDCEGEIVPLAANWSYPTGPGLQPQPVQPMPQPQPAQPAQPTQQMKCDVCGFTGNAQQVQDHYQKMIAAQDQLHMNAQPAAGNQPGIVQSKTSAGDDRFLDHNHNREERAEGNPVHRDSDESDNDPSDKFDEVVQDMANRAAAKRYSQADEDEIQEISDRYGISPEEVSKKLHIVAYFGDYIGFNGDIVNDDPSLEGLTSIDDEDLGGRVESHEALVNLDKAVKRTAEDLNTDEQNVYNSLQDSMGGTDLPNEYHASVDGQRNFYLPDELVNSSQPESTPQDSGQTS